jgi:hypothetical protein
MSGWDIWCPMMCFKSSKQDLNTKYNFCLKYILRKIDIKEIIRTRNDLEKIKLISLGEDIKKNFNKTNPLPYDENCKSIWEQKNINYFK